MVIRLSTRKETEDRQEIGRIEGFNVSWRKSDLTVWISSETSLATNYDNRKATTEEEAIKEAHAMLLIAGKLKERSN